MFEAFLNPQLLPETQAAIRMIYGALMTGTLLFFFRHGRRFFLSSRYGGYGDTTAKVVAVQNPLVMPLLGAAWLSATVLLTLGKWTVPAAAVNAACCWYFFVALRWSGLARGLGAPGFMSWWLGVCVLLLEFTGQLAPAARNLAILAVQVDFALIMLSAGIYKSIAGYRHNEGMNYGLANPAWSYWPRWYGRIRPEHFIFRGSNQLGWSMEILGAACMLIPSLRFWGGLIILLSFVYVWTQIRLGTLCAVVIACCLFFFTEGSLGSTALVALMPQQLTQTVTIASGGAAWLNVLATTVLGAYLVLLPLAHAGLFYNFLSRRSLPKLLQMPLVAYTNALGIIIWRVFSADHTRFFVRIYSELHDATAQVTSTSAGSARFLGLTLRRDDATAIAPTMFVTPAANRRVINDYATRVARFRHVVESITLTCIFTARRYFASRPEVFQNKLLTYARTLPGEPGERLVFQFVRLEKAEREMRYVAESEHTVDLKRGTVTERLLESQPAPPPRHSVVFESAGHGSYVAR